MHNNEPFYRRRAKIPVHQFRVKIGNHARFTHTKNTDFTFLRPVNLQCGGPDKCFDISAILKAPVIALISPATTRAAFLHQTDKFARFNSSRHREFRFLESCGPHEKFPEIIYLLMSVKHIFTC